MSFVCDLLYIVSTSLIDHRTVEIANRSTVGIIYPRKIISGIKDEGIIDMMLDPYIS